ncbi:hypothetical protein [Luteolibacter soli]|uniref:DUF3108 domain-containing protein n=1 Tax=Luteolibacter soli TaxID=3135280 RepID=A0ABU9AUB8_9BACT
MKIPSLLVLGLLAGPVLADALPTTNKKPWVAFYAGYEAKSFQFTVNTEGVGELIPLDKGKPISGRNAIKFQAVVEDVSADGKVFAKYAEKGAWEAVTPAAIDPEKVTYRGMAGNAKFEVNLEFDKNGVRAGGKLLEKGELKNPRFVLRVSVPNVYFYDKDAAKLDAKAKDDRIDLVRTDGKKLKFGSRTAIDGETAEVTGPGIAEAKIEMSGLKDNRFEFVAGAGASFELWNKGIAPLSEGFSLNWKADAGKDPEGKGRLVLEVK